MWHTMDINEVKRKLHTNLNIGLTDEEAKEKIQEFGYNKLKESKKESIVVKFIKQFNDFMIIILIIAATISAIMSYIQKTNEYIDSIIIIAIVVLNAIMGVIQESKAEKSIEALKKMSEPMSKVKRNGKIKLIPSEELVPGDYIIIETGCYVPADARLINSYNLKIEESALTGETIPVEKDAKAILDKSYSDGDIINMAFATTIVVNGHAEAVVTQTGMNTGVGKIAKMIITDEAPETPLQIKLRRSWKKVRISSTWNLFFNIYNWNTKENFSNRNVYDFCRTSSSSNSRRITSNSYNNTINRCNKNGKKEYYY